MSASRYDKVRFLRELASLGEEVEVRDGHLVVEEGGPADSVYFILEGEFEVARRGETIGVMQAGAVFGEIAAVTGGKRNASVKARQMGRLLRVEASDFVAVLHRQPELIIGMYRDLAGKVFDEEGGKTSGAGKQLVNFDSATVLEGLQDRRSRRARCWEEIGVWGDRSCPELEKHLHCQNCPVYEDAGRGMLDRAATTEYLENNRGLLEEDARNRVTERGLRIVPFRLGKEWFALRAALFGAVVSPRRLQRIPHLRSPILEGIKMIQGETLIQFNLAALLEVESTQEKPAGNDARLNPRDAVIGSGSNRWVFHAGAFGAVAEIVESGLEAPPVTLGKASANFTRGLIETDGRRVALLDDELLLYRLGKECE